MAKGPKGEYRPADPLKSGRLVMQIALGLTTEAKAKKATKRAAKKAASKKRTAAK